MSMGDICNNVTKRIEEEGIKPEPKFMVHSRRGMVWAAVVAFIVLAAFAAGVVIDDLIGIEFDVLDRAAKNPFHGAFLAIPIMWLGAFVASVSMAVFAIRHLPRGYRVTRILLLAVAFGIPVTTGGVLMYAKLAVPFEEGVRTAVPPYKALREAREDDFHAPDEGIVAGVILDDPSDGAFVLGGPQGAVVDVVLDDDIEVEERVYAGVRVRVLGEIEEDGRFYAERVSAWRRIGPGKAPHDHRGPKPPQKEMKEIELD